METAFADFRVQPAASTIKTGVPSAVWCQAPYENKGDKCGGEQSEQEDAIAESFHLLP